MAGRLARCAWLGILTAKLHVPQKDAVTTPLTKLLGIELPIVQAPMAGVQGSALAIAVCNAGGLGSLP